MITPRVRFRVLAHKDTALKRAPAILQKNLKGGLSAIGKRLQTSARTRMRKDTGAEQKSLTYRVAGTGLDLNVVIVSTLVQAFVDAYGLRRGVFPDFRVNSRLYNWVKRHHGFYVKLERGPDTHRGFIKSGRKIKVVKRLRSIRDGGGHKLPLGATKRARAKNSDIRRLTFLVARAIWRHGIKATGWPKKTLNANRDRIIRELKNAMSRTVSELKRA